MADNKTSEQMTDAELEQWLLYIEHPEHWYEIPWINRVLVGAMAKHGRRTIRMITAFSFLSILMLWITYHLAGLPAEPGFDLIVGAVLAILVIIFLVNT